MPPNSPNDLFEPPVPLMPPIPLMAQVPTLPASPQYNPDTAYTPDAALMAPNTSYELPNVPDTTYTPSGFCCHFATESLLHS